MLADALRFPYVGPRGTRRVLLGGLVAALGGLVVPVFWLLGYVCRCGLDVARGHREPPWPTEDVSGQVVDGLRLFAISLVYLAVPAVVSLAGAALDMVGLEVMLERTTVM